MAVTGLVILPGAALAATKGSSFQGAGEAVCTASCSSGEEPSRQE